MVSRLLKTSALVFSLSLFSPAYAVEDLAGLKVGDAIPGHYIVVLQDARLLAEALGLNHQPSGRDLAETIVKTLGVDIAADVTHLYGDALLGFAATLEEPELAFLQSHPLVSYVEQDRVIGIAGAQQGATWGLDRSDARSGLDSVYSWDYDGTGVHAYVLDTGIRSTHQEFEGRIGEGADFSGETGFFGGGSGGSFFGGGGGLFGGGDPSDEKFSPDDCNGHGTHVAGTVGGTTYGMAKGVTIHAVRVLGCGGFGSSSNSIAGLDWVVANAIRPAVVNMSLGGDRSTAQDQAVAKTVAAGISVVVAAGNDDVDACNGSPSGEPTAITVASTDNRDARSGFSNWGACVDIFAPGSNIVSASYLSDRGTNTLSGTSMASPHVAGAVAMMLHSGVSPANATAALLAQATRGAVSDTKDSPNLLMFNGGGSTAGGPVEDPVDAGDETPVPDEPTTGGDSGKPGKGGGKGKKK